MAKAVPQQTMRRETALCLFGGWCSQGRRKEIPKCLQSDRKSEACLWFTKCTYSKWMVQTAKLHHLSRNSWGIRHASARVPGGYELWHLSFFTQGQNMLTFQNVGVFIEGNYKTCWLFSVACSFVGSAVRVTLVCVQVQCTIGSSWKEICIRQECRGVLHKLSNVFTNPNLIGDPRMHQCLITCQLPNNLCSTWHLWSELWVLGRRDRTFVTTVKAEHVLLPGARWESMQWECLKS